MISFFPIFYSIILFLFIFIIHVFIWRIFNPKQQITLLFFMFIIIPVFIILLGYGILIFYKTKFLFINDLLLMLLLYLAFAGVYIQTYPAIQAFSPSLLIVYLIGKNKNPISKVKIKSIMTADNLITNKIYELEQEGFININKKTNSFSLTKKGKLLANIFLWYRKLLGLKEGDG